MIKIINLSSLHTLQSFNTGIMNGVDAFASICDRYSQNCCICCPGIFTKLTNKAWVAFMYLLKLDTLINPYKLGQINTEQFLQGLLGIFSFLNDEALNLRSDDISRINANKANFISTKDVERLETQHYVLALLEEAWNKSISFSDTDARKFEYLLEQRTVPSPNSGESEEDQSTNPILFNGLRDLENENPSNLEKKRNDEQKIYLIANTNELHVHRILLFLRENFPYVEWTAGMDLTTCVGVDDYSIEIAQNIFLCLSYKFHSFKTTSENDDQENSTPSLLRTLVEQILSQIDREQFEVVSQYPKDLVEARKLGIPEENLHEAQQYYPQPRQEIRNSQGYMKL